jgi:hypothetical protein
MNVSYIWKVNEQLIEEYTQRINRPTWVKRDDLTVNVIFEMYLSLILEEANKDKRYER